MKIAFTILVGLHGIIHVFGFLKAYGISEFEGIHQPISKVLGLIWLLTFFLFTITTILFVKSYDHWWIFGIVAAICSSILIFNVWSDAKYGTIVNIIILIAAVLGYLNKDFENSIRQERIQILENSKKNSTRSLNHEDVSESNLPEIVKKWLKYSGAVGQPIVSNVFLTQKLQLKLNPEQKKWNHGKQTFC